MFPTVLLFLPRPAWRWEDARFATTEEAALLIFRALKVMFTIVDTVVGSLGNASARIRERPHAGAFSLFNRFRCIEALKEGDAGTYCTS